MTALGLLLVAAVLGLGLGSHPLPPGRVLDAVLSYDSSNDEHLLVVISRLPRIVLGVLVGAALGLSGALMQSLTRNPLADPGILGINAGASIFVVTGIAYFGAAHISQYIWLAFLGAGLTSVAVYALGSVRRGEATPMRIALAGTAITIALTAVTQMILISNESAFAVFRYWSVGSLQGRGLDVSLTISPFLLAGTVIALLHIRSLNAMVLGEETAASLGTNVVASRLGVALAVVLLAGTATAAAGPISFIGLGAAHIVRQFVGSDHRYVIPLSLLVGAALLTVADAAGRAIVAPGELPTGIAAALVGAPIFISLVRSRRVALL